MIGSYRSCRAVGVQLGIYYSVVSNEFLNVYNGLVRNSNTLSAGQVNITQEEYTSIVIQQLSELWSNYGQLAEIWSFPLLTRVVAGVAFF